METSPLLASAPAVAALFFKAGIFLYARFSPTHNFQTQLYLLFLFALSLQNIAEIAHFFVLAEGVIPRFELKLYYVSSIAAIAILVHLAVTLSWEQRRPRAARWLVVACYLNAAALLLLVITGQQVIEGFEQIAYTVTRIPGPLYVWFEVYALGFCVLAPGLFLYGTISSESPRARAQNALLLVAILPTIVIVIVVLTLLHFGVKWLNATVILPIGITFFLMVSAYAIWHYRIFDIHFFIPWSKVRLKKTAFHNRIRKLISEIAELPTAEQVINRLATTLRCPVSLINAYSPVSSGPGALSLTKIPRSCLRGIDEITLANEIAAAKPDVYRELQSHGVAAVVPFNPNSSDTAGWLLLGQPFENLVYSSRDFRTVEELFNKISDIFLDKFVALRSMLASANNDIETLRAENALLKRDMLSMRISAAGSTPNTRSTREGTYGEDLDRIAKASNQVLPPTVTLLGRNKQLARQLRCHFPDVKAYIGASSKAFKNSRQPEVLVCCIEDEQFELPTWVCDSRAATAVLLCGEHARSFANANQDRLLGGLIDIVDNIDVTSLLGKRIHELNQLKKQCYSLPQRNDPLIGASPLFSSYIRQLQYLSAFSEPVLVYLHDDVGQFEASVSYLQEYAGRAGPAVIVEPADVRHAAALHADVPAVIGVSCVEAFSEGLEDLVELLQCRQNRRPRFVVGWPANRPDSMPEALRRATKGFTLSMPRLEERPADIALLIHYFALQFNLQSPVRAWCDQGDLESNSGVGALINVSALRTAVNELLTMLGRDSTQRAGDEIASQFDALTSEQTLDGLVAEFESRIIKQTLRRCDGNKSMAARILGLRPNTLHYKLERYGLSGDRRKASGKGQPKRTISR